MQKRRDVSNDQKQLLALFFGNTANPFPSDFDFNIFMGRNKNILEWKALKAVANLPWSGHPGKFTTRSEHKNKSYVSRLLEGLLGESVFCLKRTRMRNKIQDIYEQMRPKWRCLAWMPCAKLNKTKHNGAAETLTSMAVEGWWFTVVLQS